MTLHTSAAYGLISKADGVVTTLDSLDKCCANSCERVQNHQRLTGALHVVQNSGDERTGEASNPWYPAVQSALMVLRKGGITETGEPYLILHVAFGDTARPVRRTRSQTVLAAQPRFQRTPEETPLTTDLLSGYAAGAR